MKANFVTSKNERLSYASYFVGQNIIFGLVGSYLMLFYTDYMGLAAAAVGTLFLVARIWDAINDPIMGIIVDKSNLKGGKFKPWLNFTVIALPISTVLLFINPNFSAGAKLIYAYITYIAWGMIYTVSDVPIFSLSTAMTPNIKERMSLLSFGRVASGIAGLITGVLLMPFVQTAGWLMAAIVLALISLITMVPQMKHARERVVVKRKQMGLKEIANYINRNKYMKIVIISYAMMIGAISTMGLNNYFAIYHLGSESYIPIIGLIMGLGSLFAAMIAPKCIGKLGKKGFLVWALIINILSSLLLLMTGYGNLPVTFALIGVRTVSTFIPIVLFGMFTSDCIEYGTKETGVRAEALTFSMQTFITKLAFAMGAAVTGYALSMAGYVPNVAQTPETLDFIFKAYIFIPAISSALWLAIFVPLYDLSEDKVQAIVDELKHTA